MLENKANINSNNMYNGNIKDNDRCDVVLLQLPMWGPYHPPLALGLLKSSLKHNGISCKTFDLNAHTFSTRGKKYFGLWDLKNSFLEQFWNRQKMVEFYRNWRPLMLYYIAEIKKLNPSVVGCSVFNSSKLFTQIFLEDFKKQYPESKCKFLLGGPGVAHFMKNTDELLSCNYIDAVCQDEGEGAIVDYVNAVKNDTGLPVAGMVYKRNGKILQGPPSIYKGKLDTIPFPDFEDFNLQHYLSRKFPVYVSRGCVNKCNYCSAIGFMTNKRYPFRFRSAQRVFDEIVYLKKKYPTLEEIRFASNIDNGKISMLEDFCDLMIESGMNKKIEWTMENCVIRKEMRKPLYEKLKKAGCTYICYGLESPTKRLLKAVGKSLAVQDGVDFSATIRECKEAGINIVINIMFGLPGETDEDVDYLLKFLEKNKKYLAQINPAIEFCEYYPGASGAANPDAIGVDLSKGSLFWDSKDGKNTYLKRMERFERATKLAKKLKIDLFCEVEEIVDKHMKLFEYYYVSKDPKNAKIEYDKIDKKDLTEEVEAKYLHITTGNRSALNKFIEKCNTNNVAKLEDYLVYKGNLENSFVGESLSDYINDFIKVKHYERTGNIAKWKTNVRKFTLSVSGYNKIECLINNSLLSLNKIDSELTSMSNLQINDSVKFTPIKKAFDDLDLLINNTNKNMNNFFSGFIKKINKTSYYHKKINKMLHLFVKAFRIIDDDKSNLLTNSSSDNLNSIKKELSQLFNSTDKNETRIFSKLQIESRIVALYNRIVGYRNSEREMAMLHTVITLIIKKMIVLKNKEHVNYLNDADSNPIRTSVPQSLNI